MFSFFFDYKLYNQNTLVRSSNKNLEKSLVQLADPSADLLGTYQHGHRATSLSLPCTDTPAAGQQAPLVGMRLFQPAAATAFSNGRCVQGVEHQPIWMAAAPMNELCSESSE
jgi:hypothetical protein